MISPRVIQLLTGNTGKLRDYKELAVLPVNFTPIYMFHTAFLCFQSTEAIPMCIVHGILKPQQVFF
jgi:hypothetical protein